MNRSKVKWHEAMIGTPTRKLDCNGEYVYCIYADYGPMVADGH